MADQCETPMADHVKRFFELLKVPGAIVRVDTPNPLGYDTASFGEGFAAALRATPSLAGEDVGPEDRAEQFIQAAIDSGPEPLRRLGEWLANKLDDDDWKTAERMLLGASVEARSLSSRVEALEALVKIRTDGLVSAVEAHEEACEIGANNLNEALRQRARAEAAETRSAELARALNELIIAADSLAITANLSQADREIDRALSALAGHDAAIHTGDDDE